MLSIIIPTFNERDIILQTISSIQDAIDNNFPYEIIVADDDSPDKTWKLVDTASKKDSHIRFLRRKGKQKGLSRSVVDGFDHAKGDYFLVIDADGQHDEKIIPRMYDKAKSSDVVVASRFIKGGGVSDWSKSRLLISRSFSLLSRPLLKAKTSDPMSGFFLVKKTVYEKVKNDLDLSGYKILLALLFASQKYKKPKVKEVPYMFRPRELGESKASLKVAFQYIGMLFKQAYCSNRKFLKFAVVGTSGVLVNYAVLILFKEIVGLYLLFASAIAVETSIITNFLLNNFWTWKSNRHTNSFAGRFLRFNLVSLIALALNVSILFVLTEYVGMWYIIANAFGILVGMLVNFSMNDKWTFKKNVA
ncbi:MAG: glycosyltransferase [Nanobdellota archaeon]